MYSSEKIITDWAHFSEPVVALGEPSSLPMMPKSMHLGSSAESGSIKGKILCLKRALHKVSKGVSLFLPRWRGRARQLLWVRWGTRMRGRPAVYKFSTRSTLTFVLA